MPVSVGPIRVSETPSIVDVGGGRSFTTLVVVAPRCPRIGDADADRVGALDQVAALTVVVRLAGAGRVVAACDRRVPVAQLVPPTRTL